MVYFRIVVGLVVVFATALRAVPGDAASRELATAQGPIVISDARPGLRSPSCNELVVEARDALDNHLIAETQPTVDEAGLCQYALTVPAQTAVWLRVQPALVAGIRVINGVMVSAPASRQAPLARGSVALRFTIISPTTYFFAPGVTQIVRLVY